tara:strand:- start:27750 stop:28328 length:579 start_codon:yes stop_codon:yes gene_type:complete
MRDVEIIARGFRNIRKSIDEIGRRLAASHMTGKVAEIDGNKVRLELLPADPRTGKPFLSPWVQLQDAAGGTASHTPVAIGDPMRLLSPFGEIGQASIAVRDSHVQDSPNPASDPDELVLMHAGNEIRMRAGSMLLKRGSTTFELTDEGFVQVAYDIAITSSRLSHNGLDVGSTHKHGGVVPGAALTQVPTPI